MIRRLILMMLVPMAMWPGFTSGSQTCPASGNKAVIASSTSCPGGSCKSNSWTVQAATGNTGKVYIGGSTVTTSNGVYLAVGDAAYLASGSNTFPFDLTQVYIACTVSADSVTYNYYQ